MYVNEDLVIFQYINCNSKNYNNKKNHGKKL